MLPKVLTGMMLKQLLFDHGLICKLSLGSVAPFPLGSDKGHESTSREVGRSCVLLTICTFLPGGQALEPNIVAWK